MGAKTDSALRTTGYALSGVALVGGLIFPGLHLLVLAAILAVASSQIKGD